MTSCAFAQDYDLSVLPSYKAAQNQLRVIRVHGSQLTVNLIHRWEEDFLQLHPDIRYRENILPSWFSGLCAGTEDLTVMGHDAWRPDQDRSEGEGISALRSQSTGTAGTSFARGTSCP
jgi:phosphate transport system substrate-binding protein